MSTNLVLQTPVITASTVTLTFVVGAVAVESFNLSIDVDSAVLNASSVGATGPAGWTVLPNAAGSTLLISGYSLTALATGSTLVTITIGLQPGASATPLVLNISGDYNDPAVTIAPYEYVYEASTTITGTESQDVLESTSATETILGLGGDDLITGGANDTLTGGAGQDQFTLSSGTVQITDLAYGETLTVSGASFGAITAAGGTGPLANQIQWSSSGGNTTLLVGLDSVAGADLTVSLTGSFALSDFQASGETILLNRLPGGSLSISGSPYVGQTLTLTDTLTDADGINARTYQWLADGAFISGANGTTLVVSASELGKAISVVADYTDANGVSESVTSSATAAVTRLDNEATGTLGVTGTAQEGGTLVAALTSVVDADGSTSTAYRWQENTGTAETPNWVDISGATSATLSIPSDQSYVGKTVRVVATTTDPFGGTTEFTSAGQTIANVNDPTTGSVSISGTPTQGQTLTASNTLGDVDGLGPISYQWTADGANIESATSSTLVLGQAQVGKVINVVASYTDAQGAYEFVISWVPTAPVANINDAPAGGVTISGTPTQGQTLTAANTLADVDGLGPITYQWKADGSNISGATASTLVLGQAQVGKTITVTASYTDGQGTAESVTSAATFNVANVEDEAMGILDVTGTAQEGGSLVASLTSVVDADGATTTAYRWQENTGTVGSPNWVNIAGATSATLSIPSDQSYVGKSVRVVATTTDALGGTTDFNGAAQTIVNVNDAPTGSVSISGIITEGQTLIASSTLADADGLGTVNYQWKANGAAIAGATSSTFVLGASQIGQSITVSASYTDRQGTPESVTSAATPNVTAIGSGLVIVGNASNEVLSGAGAGDTISGGDGFDRLLGLGGDDSLDGGSGTDLLTGGAGADTLTGGAGADRFIYTSRLDSGNSLGTRDVITDFLAGTDRIDLSGVDANTAASGNQTFSWRGLLAFSGAGELRMVYDAGSSQTRIEANIDSDTSTVEMSIALSGNYTSGSTTLQASDIVL